MPTPAILPRESLLKNASAHGDLFPVHLKTTAVKILFAGVSGAGLDLLTKLLSDMPEADVCVVAEDINEHFIRPDKVFPHIKIEARIFRPTDLLGKNVIFIATGNAKTDTYIGTLAGAQHLFFSKLNDPDGGNMDLLFDFVPRKEKYLLAREENFRPKRIASISLAVFAVMLIGHFLFSFFPFRNILMYIQHWAQSLEPGFGVMLLAGFLAQLVDGALGMGYGVTSSTILLSAGINPAAISGSIHTAKLFTNGASGYTHFRFGNVNKKLFKALVIPGVLGAMGGAILLIQYGTHSADYIRPVMAVYTLLLSVRIFYNAFRKLNPQKKFKSYGWLAAAGGFLDSFGGGGWGPIVTTTLLTRGRARKYVVGSVGLSEFFVTLASAFTFFLFLGVTHWQTILALIIGGVIAAPLAARLAGKLPRKTSFILLGILVITWSLKILVAIF